MSDGALTLKIPNSLDALSAALEDIEAFGASQNWPTSWLFNTNLAIDELLSNVIKYGYGDATESHEIVIELLRADEALTIILRDDGVAFDPLADAPPPDLDSNVDDRPIGGLGVHLVKTLVDEVRYARVDGQNEVTLIQRGVV